MATRKDLDAAREAVREKKASILETGFMTAAEFADSARVSIETLYVWNCRGLAPARYKIGRSVFYLRSDVETWLESKLVVMV